MRSIPMLDEIISFFINSLLIFMLSDKEERIGVMNYLVAKNFLLYVLSLTPSLLPLSGPGNAF